VSSSSMREGGVGREEGSDGGMTLCNRYELQFGRDRQGGERDGKKDDASRALGCEEVVGSR